jgi:hypothetical protein
LKTLAFDLTVPEWTHHYYLGHHDRPGFGFFFTTCRFKTLAFELTALEQSLGAEGSWAKMGKGKTPVHHMATTLLYAADGKTVSGMPPAQGSTSLESMHFRLWQRWHLVH